MSKLVSFGLAIMLLGLAIQAGLRGEPLSPLLVVGSPHAGRILSLASSDTGRLLASAGADGVVKIWDRTGSRQIRSFVAHASKLAFLPKSPHWLVASSTDGLVTIWDATTGRPLRSTAKLPDISALAVSPDGARIATGHEDGAIRLWRRTLDEEAVLKADSRPVTSLSFGPGGAVLASAGQEGPITIWDIRARRPAYHFGSQRTVRDFAFDPTGQLLASTDGRDTTSIWEVARGALRTSITRQQTGHSVAFSPDGKLIASGGRRIAVSDVESGKVLQIHSAGPYDEPVTFSSDGKLLVSAGSGGRDDSSGFLKVWDVQSGKFVSSSTPAESSFVRSLDLSSDGRVLVAGVGTTIAAWDLCLGERLPTSIQPRDEVNAVRFSPDGKLIAVGTDTYLDPSQALVLSESLQGETLRPLQEAEELGFRQNRSHVRAIAFSPKGTLLASGSVAYRDGDTDTDRAVFFNRIIMWDVRTGKEVKSLEGHTSGVWSVAFSPDGKFLVSGSGYRDAITQADNSVRIWDVGTGKQLRILKGHRGSVRSVAVSPDGRTVASGSSDHSVTLWNSATGRVVCTLSGHSDSVYSVAFSPTGAELATAGADNSIVIWDVRTCQQRTRLEGHSNPVLALRYSSSGNLLFSGAADGTIKLWRPASQSNGTAFATIASLPDQAWLAANSAGQFDTRDLEHTDRLSWIVPDDPLYPLPPEIFLRQYYEPRLLPRLLAGGTLPAVPPLESLNRVQPTVKIAAVQAGKSPDQAEVTVEVSPASGQFQRNGRTETMSTEVYDLRLFRDGQLVGQEPELSVEEEARLENGVALSPEELKAWQAARLVKPVPGRVNRDPGGSSLRRTFTVRLPHSRIGQKVTFTAYAFNEDRVKSATATQDYDVPQGLTPVKPRAYLLSVGVNAYEKPGWNLRFAASDARRMQDALKKRLPAGYEVVPVELISDCQQAGCPTSGNGQRGVNRATKAALQAVLTLLAGQPLTANLKQSLPPGAEQLQKATPDDVVILTVSSHGYTRSDGMFYLIPSDSGQTDGTQPFSEALLRKWISSDELAAWLRDVDAGEMALIVDTCHSAATVESPGFKPGPMGSRGLGQLAYDKGLRILAASQANDVALESDKIQQGLLTYALLQEGLEEGKAAPAGSKGAIPLQAWLQYGVDRVPKLFDDIRAGRVVKRELQSRQERRELRVSTADGRSKNTGIAVQLSPAGTSSLDKPRAFQQPTLFDFRRVASAVVLNEETK